MNRFIINVEEPEPISVTMPADMFRHSGRIKNLINHLSGNEDKKADIRITVGYVEVKAQCNNVRELSLGERFQLFNRDNFLGNLDFYEKEDEIWYTGKSLIRPEYIRMIYAQGKREDVWDVKFP